MNGQFYPDGAQVAIDIEKPCELCYCIRNRTACVMQECILHVEGCEPIFEHGVCCPVRYLCDSPPGIEATTIAGLISTTVANLFTTPSSTSGGCYREGEFYYDGSRIPTPGEAPCEHCYCMRGEVRREGQKTTTKSKIKSYQYGGFFSLSDCLCCARLWKSVGERRWRLQGDST